MLLPASQLTFLQCLSYFAHAEHEQPWTAAVRKAVFVSLTPEELSQQIKEARAKQDQNLELKPPKIGEQKGEATGKALRAASDLVAALLVGGFLGYWVDKWLHTLPLFLIIFFFLGFGAGFLNIYRAQMGESAANKLDKDDKKTDKEEK